MDAATVRAALPVGSILKRKAPLNDEWDEVQVIAHADFLLEGGGEDTEAVIRPTAEFAAPIHCAVEALDEHYLVVREGENPGAWEGNPLDAFLRRDPDAQRAAQEVMRVRTEPDPEPAPVSPNVERYTKQRDPLERINRTLDSLEEPK